MTLAMMQGGSRCKDKGRPIIADLRLHFSESKTYKLVQFCRITAKQNNLLYPQVENSKVPWSIFISLWISSQITIYTFKLYRFFPKWLIASEIMEEVKYSLTCAFLQAARPFTMHSQFTVKVFLPEFSKPNISSVVGQRTATEIPVKCCVKDRQGKG